MKRLLSLLLSLSIVTSGGCSFDKTMKVGAREQYGPPSKEDWQGTDFIR